MPETLSPDELLIWKDALADLQTAQLAYQASQRVVNFILNSLAKKYKLVPPDAIGEDGAITRTPLPVPSPGEHEAA